MEMRNKRAAGVIISFFGLGVAFSANAQPSPPDKDLLNSGWQLPHMVAMPGEVAAGPLAAQQPFFDDFSWRSFIALNWPAALGPDGIPLRGVPDQQISITSFRGTRTWESWKAAWELFKQTLDPTAFDKYDDYPAACPQARSSGPSKRLFVMTSKADSLLDEINEAFTGPLIDQNRNYVRYEIRLNETEYNVVRDNRWFIASNLPAEVAFPSSIQAPTATRGAIELKAAWRELFDGQDDLSRYYWTDAFLLEPGTPMTCRQARMGLIGLHIVHKVSPFREWIWSTFEHVDNVPDPARLPRQTYSLNNGTAVPATVNGFHYPPKPGSVPDKLVAGQPIPPKPDLKRTPVQVTRFTPIRSDTQQVNAAYQQLLHGTPWEFYQALPTQWPSVRHGAQFKADGSYPADSGNPFPIRHVANTAAETYFQNSRATSCMECHYQTASTDFSWVLAIRAISDTPVSAARRDKLFGRLLEAVKQ
jgi:hypothetical protein